MKMKKYVKIIAMVLVMVLLLGDVNVVRAASNSRPLAKANYYLTYTCGAPSEISELSVRNKITATGSDTILFTCSYFRASITGVSVVASLEDYKVSKNGWSSTGSTSVKILGTSVPKPRMGIWTTVTLYDYGPSRSVDVKGTMRFKSN